jgi:cytochrome c oxidase assembly protein subunit 15
MTTNPEPRAPTRQRWLHRWALLTFCATLPLLLLGAEVTTKQVGMVDRVGFRAPWHLFTVSWQEKGLGFLIEHSHRLAGFLVGTCAIVLAVLFWLWEPRRWARWLGLAALLGVSAQGVLGILRVNYNDLAGEEIALVHGCFAPLVVSLLASLALFTSREWTTPAETPTSPHDATRIARWSLLTCVLVYFQIVLGAVVRHEDLPLGARAHLLTAFAVVAAVAWLVKLVFDAHLRERLFRNTVFLLPVLVAVQVFLGVEAWLSKFATTASLQQQIQPLTIQPQLLRSLHALAGSLILASAVVVALQARRIASMAIVQVEVEAPGLVPTHHSPLTTHPSSVGGAA